MPFCERRTMLRFTSSWRVAAMLRSAEEAGRLTFVRMQADKLNMAPRLTMFGGVANEELYDDTPRKDLLSGLGSEVCFRRHGMEDLASLWIAKHVNDVLESSKSDVFSSLLDRLVVHRFQAGEPRDIPAVFSELNGHTIEVEIQDPWIGAQNRNREKLADFLSALRKAGVTIESLKLVWNPRNGEDTPQTQKLELGNAAALHVSGNLEFRPWVPSRGQHFHDRVVQMRQQDTVDTWRVDVRSGIDNLMSYQKECSLFIEKT